MKRVRLDRVVKKCLDDKKFFEALVRNPESTLRRADMELSRRDVRKLKIRLRYPSVKVNFLDLVRIWHERTGPVWKYIPIWWFRRRGR